jgi:hypothetical protein
MFTEDRERTELLVAKVQELKEVYNNNSVKAL